MNSLMYNDELRFCKGNFCVQARGQNAELLSSALAFLIVLMALAAVAKAVS